MAQPTKKKLRGAAATLGKAGGFARAKKLTAEQLTAIGKLGGRPRKKPAAA